MPRLVRTEAVFREPEAAWSLALSWILTQEAFSRVLMLYNAR
jgi:hypothetical protein